MIVGPTAVGKTALVARLAERVRIEIVNADALQCVRGLDIGTGKPTAVERGDVPHHLFDTVEPEVRFSAGEYARRARVIVGEILARGRLPVAVGGSGFYVQALLEGLAPLPTPDPGIRASLRREWEEDPDRVRSELERRDPETSRRLDPADRQRILRALEVARQTGSPLSSWHAEHPPVPADFGGRLLGLERPRDELVRRIDRRIRRMLEDGWLEEVRSLLRRGVAPSAPGLQAIGYRDLVEVVEGRTSLEDAIPRIERATRRYAKRQRTFFKRWDRIEWSHPEDPELLDRARRIAVECLRIDTGDDRP